MAKSPPEHELLPPGGGKQVKGELCALPSAAELPPILAGSDTPETRARFGRFLQQLHEIFEAWVTQTKSPNTQDAKRRSWQQFVDFLEMDWDSRPWEALNVTVLEVRRFRENLEALNRAPKTIHGRLACLSSFYRYLAQAASELRVSINHSACNSETIVWRPGEGLPSPIRLTLKQ